MRVEIALCFNRVTLGLVRVPESVKGCCYYWDASVRGECLGEKDAKGMRRSVYYLEGLLGQVGGGDIVAFHHGRLELVVSFGSIVSDGEHVHEVVFVGLVVGDELLPGRLDRVGCGDGVVWERVCDVDIEDVDGCIAGVGMDLVGRVVVQQIAKVQNHPRAGLILELCAVVHSKVTANMCVFGCVDCTVPFASLCEITIRYEILRVKGQGLADHGETVEVPPESRNRYL
ncbi:hypothetical protein ASPWEDRAFT_691921 [Aspergillus wentii DTO 134E9]|uniref:Uncharacterized protein n=1 Tax=Aspergillus wentii DTO 134E9 TaxID=1073089 RepID=A0A1L9R9A7_ASPWE|nr:uncharacterized protein ASPWEDRAFT_691921 [Aspergillus wentii DTO 134E9]OJJ31437.1 hypothetical protein ASPWEDRAFT_691921 [Aspergillus wentii DTO 134E9]